ncbi:MAG: DUF2510 domain-containing protein [Acidimicrobiales bacterium]
MSWVSWQAPARPGWYRDPWGTSYERWWNGSSWTVPVRAARHKRLQTAGAKVVAVLTGVCGLVAVAGCLMPWVYSPVGSHTLVVATSGATYVVTETAFAILETAVGIAILGFVQIPNRIRGVAVAVLAISVVAGALVGVWGIALDSEVPNPYGFLHVDYGAFVTLAGFVGAAILSGFAVRGRSTGPSWQFHPGAAGRVASTASAVHIPGWYSSPGHLGFIRWWNGTAWTEFERPAQ